MSNVIIDGITYVPDTSEQATVPGFVACQVVKSADESRYTLGVAYPAHKADVGTAADGHRDFVSADVLERAAWGFMTKSRNIGIAHQDGTDGGGTVVESYIYRGPQWVTKAADGTTQTVEPGDWLLGVQWKQETWGLIKSGAVCGFSPQGAARRGTASVDDLAKLRK